MNNIAQMDMTPALFLQALHMPAGTNIKAIKWLPDAGPDGLIRITLTHPDLPECQNNGDEPLPRTIAAFRRRRSEIVFEGWRMLSPDGTWWQE